MIDQIIAYVFNFERRAIITETKVSQVMAHLHNLT